MPVIYTQLFTQCKKKTTFVPPHPIIWKRLQERNLLNLGSECYSCIFWGVLLWSVLFNSGTLHFWCPAVFRGYHHRKWEELNSDENITPRSLDWTSISLLSRERHMWPIASEILFDSRIHHAAWVYASAAPTHTLTDSAFGAVSLPANYSWRTIIFSGNPWYLLLTQGP